MAGVYSETSCFLPIKGVGGLLQHNPPALTPSLPSPLLPTPPHRLLSSAQSVSTPVLPSPAMFAPSVIPRHVNHSPCAIRCLF